LVDIEGRADGSRLTTAPIDPEKDTLNAYILAARAQLRFVFDIWYIDYSSTQIIL
jgi:hypothetical protein